MSEYNENNRTSFEESAQESQDKLTFGQKVSDAVAKFGGSCFKNYLAAIGGLLIICFETTFMTNRENLYYLYWVENLSTKEIAPLFNVNPQTISNWMKKMDINIRTSAESTRGVFNKKRTKPIYKKRKYTIDENVFSSINNDSAWVLGLIVSDGCLNKECNKWSICQKDSEILEKIKIIIKTNRPITHRRNPGFANGNDIYQLCVQNTKQTHDLVNIGLTPNKSKTATFPSVDDCFKWDVIRGILDGDGWIGFDRKQRYSVGWCGSKDIIHFIGNFIDNYLDDNKIKPKQSGNIWVIKFSKKQHVKQILDLIYKNSHVNNRMNRKYERYLSFLEVCNE